MIIKHGMQLSVFFKFFRIVILGTMLLQCRTKINDSQKSSDGSLQLIDSYKLKVPEPSGLSLGENNQTLWTVSDPPVNQIYELDLNGNILRILDFKGDDLEGIAYDSVENVLWIAEEQKRELVKLALDGTELELHPIAISGPENSGLEGICLAAENQLWIVNKKNPRHLLPLNEDFSIQQQFDFNMVKDLSGLCYDAANEQFWILSAESRLLMCWSQQSGIIAQFDLPAKNPEGIAVDFNENLIYIVSDSEAKLYVFKKVDL